ncbi:MAG: metallophosphoesterase, partial [Acidobacteriota bacterium]|nr:metallophosphoesterase [Acidobacteriota bacterium]
MRTIVHISDIHFGRFDESLRAPLLESIAALSPHVVVLSGDLTQRARSIEFAEARRFLDDLPAPYIVVPGNHDVPLHNMYHRLARPLNAYRRHITEELTPFYSDDEIAVLGINTARSLIWKNGRVNHRQIACIRERFCETPSGRIKILVTHHPFDLPERYTSSDLVGRAGLAMATIASCSVDLLLAGHFHLSNAGETAFRYGMHGHSAIFIQAGTLSKRGRGEANSFNAIRVGGDEIVIERFAWTGGFEPV